MERIKNNYHYIVSILAVAGVVFAATNSNHSPLFPNLDSFILFAQEKLKLEKGVQISSGDLGSNEEIKIDKDSIISGNLFADEIEIDKNTIINGNVSFNNLKTQKDAKILGTQTKPVSLPIANLPEIPKFQTGTQDFKFEGQNNTLAAGSYRDVVLEKSSRLTLTGGIYNLNKLELKENSTLIFSAPTTLNIQFKLKGQERIAILPGNNNLKPTDLVINHLGIRSKQEKEEKEDDDEKINSPQDEKEKKDSQDGKIGRPIVFGKNSFLNFKLLAPKASVHLGEASTVRGQISGRKIKIEKDSVLSRITSGIKEFDPAKVIIDSEKSVYPANEVIINFTSSATALDAQLIAELLNGVVVGHISFANAYQIQVSASTEAELDTIIERIKSLNNPKVEGVFPNFIRSIEDL